MKQTLLILTLFILFFSCNGEKEKNTIVDAARVNALHKKILATSKDSVLYYLTKIDALINTNYPDSVQAENAYLRGYYFFSIKKIPDSAYIYYNKAISFSKDSIQWKREVNYYYNLANVYLTNDKNANALSVINRFEQMANKSNNLNLLARTYDFKQYYYSIFHDYDNMLKYNLLNQTIFNKQNDTINLALNVIDKAAIFFKKNENKKGRKILDSILKVKTFNKSTDYVYFSSNDQYGDFFVSKKEYYLALLKYKKAITHFKRSAKKEYQDPKELADLYLKTFKTSIHLEKYKISEKYKDTINRNYKQYLNNTSKKDFLLNQLKLSFYTNKDFSPIQKQLDSLYSFLNNTESKRVSSKLYELEKLANKEKELIITKQEITLKNQKLKQRQLVLGVLLGLFALLSIIVYLLYKQRKNKTEQDAVFMQQRLFRAQMNPHFTSNVLFTIQSLIQSAPQKASDYLVKFSKLLRLSLENSMADYIPLENELELLTKYLDLQQMRYPAKFDYEFILNNIPEDAGIKIPPMLIQPFVENAIIHGVLNVDYKGKISIDLKQTTEFIQCIITDNGKGIQNNTKTRKSVSTQLIKDLIKKMTKTDVKITTNIVVGSGTIIVMNIPYIIAFD